MPIRKQGGTGILMIEIIKCHSIHTHREKFTGVRNALKEGATLLRILAIC